MDLGRDLGEPRRQRPAARTRERGGLGPEGGGSCRQQPAGGTCELRGLGRDNEEPRRQQRADGECGSPRLLPGPQQGALNGHCHKQRAVSELRADPCGAARNQPADIAEGGDDPSDHEPEQRSHEGRDGRNGVLDRLHGALAHGLTPALGLLPPFDCLLALTLALQPAIMPRPVGLDGGILDLEPALMVVEILFGREQNLARPDDRLLDFGNGRLERGNAFAAIGVLVPRRPCAFLTHRADHGERLP